MRRAHLRISQNDSLKQEKLDLHRMPIIMTLVFMTYRTRPVIFMQKIIFNEALTDFITNANKLYQF
jgi:hypothetical protein